MNKYRHHKTKEAAFWDRVVVRDGCWGWLGNTQKGYGRLGFRGKSLKAYRIAWEIHNGPIPEGLCVCHKCDNPECTNPQHLFLGTYADNQHDCYKKGRRARGSKNGKHTKPESTVRGEVHGRARLTSGAVRRIRKLYASGVYSQDILSQMFNTPQTNISLIVRRKAWTHVK